MRAGDRRYGWLLLPALLAPAPALADYKDTYASALNAVKDDKWAEVRSKMQDAIGQNAVPAARVRLYGQRFEPYVPQFYLGLAAYKLGDCATAAAQWKNPASQQIVAGLPELKAQQEQGLAACDSRLAQQTPKPEPKPEPVTPKPEPRPEPPKPEPPRPEPRPEPPKPVEPRPEPPKPASARVSAPLLDAYRAYLAGKYAEVARLNARLAPLAVDVCFAGIGENCHLAFNDPPADFTTTEPYLVVELDAACRRQQANEGWFASITDVPSRAVSMSIRQIMKSEKLILAVSDTRKAEAVRHALEGPVTPDYPASIIQQHPAASIHLDRAAAALLTQQS